MTVIKATDTDFKKIIADNDKVVVKFFADWCGTCRLFTPKFKRLSDDPHYEGVTFLDVDAEESLEARKIAGVDNLPFFATFKNGELFEAKATAMEEKVVIMIQNLE